MRHSRGRGTADAKSDLAPALVFLTATGNVVLDGFLIGIETHFWTASQEGR